MQKRVLSLFIGVILINLVSAQTFSLTNFFDTLDPSTTILVALFLIFFALLNFALSNVFKDRYTGEPNRAIAGVISFAVSFLIVYGLYQTNFDIEGLFFDIGVSEGLLYTLIPIVFIIFVIVLLWKFKSATFFILGFLFALIAIFTDWVYEKTTLLIIGGVLIAVGIIWWLIRRRTHSLGYYGGKAAGGAWKGAKWGARKGWGAGKWGARKGWGAPGYVKGRFDPRERLERYQERQRRKEEKRLAKRRLKYKKEQATKEKKSAREELRQLKRRR